MISSSIRSQSAHSYDGRASWVIKNIQYDGWPSPKCDFSNNRAMMLLFHSEGLRVFELNSVMSGICSRNGYLYAPFLSRDPPGAYGSLLEFPLFIIWDGSFQHEIRNVALLIWSLFSWIIMRVFFIKDLHMYILRWYLNVIAAIRIDITHSFWQRTASA